MKLKTIYDILNSDVVYDYDDISFAPTKFSSLLSRSEADTGVDCFGIHLNIPMIASPMPDVCDGHMAAQMAILGALGIIHRFQSIENEVKEFKLAQQTTFDYYDDCEQPKSRNIACAIGATGDYQERFEKLLEAGCRIFCIDTANGSNVQVVNAVNWIRTRYSKPEINLIVGNVATSQALRHLISLDIDAVRVGIAGGSVCRTRNETGIYVPMISSVADCADFRDKENSKVLIIADGGIKTPGDLAKILSVGADLAFCGSIFAGTKEAPSLGIRIDGTMYKTYRGAASFGVQLESKGYNPSHVEGAESLVQYAGSVEKVIERFRGGLQSNMSYNNARNLDELRINARYVLGK